MPSAENTTMPPSDPPLRSDNRTYAELRPVRIVRRYLRYGEGSALIEMGHTRVICSATVEDRVPRFLHGTGKGWITAEYGMLPRSAQVRIPREGHYGHSSGRTQEIQRLIGRSLRSVSNLTAMGERQIIIDCDVLEADGGTRTAAITGAFVALYDAAGYLEQTLELKKPLLHDFVAAVSVGIIAGQPMLDLCYSEDVTAEVDMNLVMTGDGRFVEVQGTAEQSPFSEQALQQLLELGRSGINQLISLQKAVLKQAPEG